MTKTTSDKILGDLEDQPEEEIDSLWIEKLRENEGLRRGWKTPWETSSVEVKLKALTNLGNLIVN